MENASKALIMAAGILIGILLLSLAVYLFVSFGSTSAKLHQQKAEAVLAQFNAQFTSYEGKENVTIHDVVTIANLATETNTYYDFKKSEHNNLSSDATDNCIYVTLNGTRIEGWSDSKKQFDDDIYNEINLHMVTDSTTGEKRLRTYKCKVEISKYTGRVWKVAFYS